MKLAPFTVQLVDRTIAFTGDDGEHTDEYDEGAVDDAGFREALVALDSDCWDSVDLRGDGTIIAYPADSHQDLRSGAYESTQVIIKARRPEWADRLYDAWQSTRRASA